MRIFLEMVKSLHDRIAISQLQTLPYFILMCMSAMMQKISSFHFLLSKDFSTIKYGGSSPFGNITFASKCFAVISCLNADDLEISTVAIT